MSAECSYQELSGQVVEECDLQPKLLATNHRIRQVERQEERFEHDQLASQQRHRRVFL